MMVLIIIFVAVFVVIVAIGSTDSRARTIDLKSVRDAMISRHGWSAERADAARVEYLKFLAILHRKPTFPVVPWLTDGRDDLDQFWHQHILDTAKYSRDCRHLFGKLVHHDPHLKKGSKEEIVAESLTQALDIIATVPMETLRIATLLHIVAALTVVQAIVVEATDAEADIDRHPHRYPSICG